MLSMNRTYLNNYNESTNLKNSELLNELNEIDKLNQLKELNRIDQKADFNQETNSNKISESDLVKNLNQINQLNVIDQLKLNNLSSNSSNNSSNQFDRLKTAIKLDDQCRLGKLNKMFRRISNLKATKNDKKSSTDKPTAKFDKNRPSITVIHKTVTKNNVKLFTNTVNQNVFNNLEDHQLNKTRSISPQSINQSTTQSITHSDYLNGTNIQFNDSNLSSLSLINQTNRKIEDIKSRSETKLSNYNCQRKESNKMKSEVDKKRIIFTRIDFNSLSL